MVGISEALLLLWIDTKHFKPLIELSAAHPVTGEHLLGWHRFIFTTDDIARLRNMVEQTAASKAKAEAHHQPGSHYTVQELAQLWGLGLDKIRELFEDEPGVIKIQKPKQKGKRRYTTLRIPENVAQRVQRRLS
jgi:hypothetical protein